MCCVFCCSTLKLRGVNVVEVPVDVAAARCLDALHEVVEAGVELGRRVECVERWLCII